MPLIQRRYTWGRVADGPATSALQSRYNCNIADTFTRASTILLLLTLGSVPERSLPESMVLEPILIELFGMGLQTYAGGGLD